MWRLYSLYLVPSACTSSDSRMRTCAAAWAPWTVCGVNMNRPALISVPSDHPPNVKVFWLMLCSADSWITAPYSHYRKAAIVYKLYVVFLSLALKAVHRKSMQSCEELWISSRLSSYPTYWDHFESSRVFLKFKPLQAFHNCVKLVTSHFHFLFVFVGIWLPSFASKTLLEISGLFIIYLTHFITYRNYSVCCSCLQELRSYAHVTTGQSCMTCSLYTIRQMWLIDVCTVMQVCKEFHYLILSLSCNSE